MQLKAITSVLLLSGTAFAAENAQKRQDIDLGGLVPDNLSSYITYAPSSVRDKLSEPTALYSILGDINQGNAPDWFSQLPQSVQGAVSSGAAEASEFLPSPTSGSNDPEETNAAARPTGAVAASLAGAAGILGLAVAL